MTQVFTQTSDDPYDKHHYRLTYTNGQSIIIESWEELQKQWWQTPSHFLSHAEVLDIPKKKKSNGGFK